MKNILVTGGCGFIASNFINSLCQKEFFIVNLDKISYCSNETNVKPRENYRLVKGNISNKELLTFLIEKYDFEQVYHFAAHSHVDNSFNDPIQFTIENALGTHVLIETFRHLKPNVEFIHFSTDEVYGESKSEEPFNEECGVLTPTNPYSASKAAAEMIVRSYIESFKMKIKIIRCNNVYGPNQFPEKLIPKFVKLLNEGSKCTLHGTKSSEVKRAFIHVDDVSEAVRTVVSNGKVGEIYNISSDYELSVLDVTKLIIKLVKKTDDWESWVEHVEDRPFNDKRYYIDSTKLRTLGWKPTHNLEHLKFHIIQLTQHNPLVNNPDVI